MVLCQGKGKKGQVDRNPGAIITDKRVTEGNLDRLLSMLARFCVSRIILLPILFVVIHKRYRLMGSLISISLNNESAYCYVLRSPKASENLHMDCPVMALNSIIALQILLGSIMRSSPIDSLFFIR